MQDLSVDSSSDDATEYSSMTAAQGPPSFRSLNTSTSVYEESDERGVDGKSGAASSSGGKREAAEVEELSVLSPGPGGGKAAKATKSPLPSPSFPGDLSPVPVEQSLDRDVSLEQSLDRDVSVEQSLDRDKTAARLIRDLEILQARLEAAEAKVGEQQKEIRQGQKELKVARAYIKSLEVLKSVAAKARRRMASEKQTQRLEIESNSLYLTRPIIF